MKDARGGRTGAHYYDRVDHVRLTGRAFLIPQAPPGLTTPPEALATTADNDSNLLGSDAHNL